MPLVLDAEPHHEVPVTATCKQEVGADVAAKVAATDDENENESETRRRDRHSFIKLLRDGVQHKLNQELQADAEDQFDMGEGRGSRTTSSSSSSSAGDRHDASIMMSSSPPTAARQRNRSRRSCSSGGGAWRTLAWRDAFSTEPFFEAMIDGKPLRIKQILQGELNGFGTGLTVWPAACVLLKHLDHRFAGNNQLETQFVLELGSGTGAVAVAAAMLHAGRVVVTDMDKLLFIMQENVQLAQDTKAPGQSATAVQVESYEWGAQPSEAIIPTNAPDRAYPDLILVSDCILPRLYPIEPLVDALDLLSKAHTRVLISFEYRYYEQFDPKQKFWELMRARGFALRVIDDDEYHPHFKADDIEIWELSRQS